MLIIKPKLHIVGKYRDKKNLNVQKSHHLKMTTVTILVNIPPETSLYAYVHI